MEYGQEEITENWWNYVHKNCYSEDPGIKIAWITWKYSNENDNWRKYGYEARERTTKKKAIYSNKIRLQDTRCRPEIKNDNSWLRKNGVSSTA